MRNKHNRAISIAAASAIALTSLGIGAAAAAPITKHQSAAEVIKVGNSSRRRGNHHANRAVLGAVAGIFGTIAALAARDRYERDYRHRHYYAPYGPPPPYGYYRPYYR